MAATGILGVSAVAAGAYYYAFGSHHPSAPPQSAAGLLDRADTLAWGNRWSDAQPLYEQARRSFEQQHLDSKALYAAVSQIPADEAIDMPATILRLSDDLSNPAAQDPETRLRILTIRGMLEIDFDAAQARATWQQVAQLALNLHQYRLASRADGEQGIAAFMLGDTDTAKKKVVRAWGLAKLERDPAATVRYASVFGVGLVHIHRYKEALTPLDQAIHLATSTPEVAYPSIAVYAKIDALAGLHQYEDALKLANASLERLQGTRYDGHKTQVYIARGSVNKSRGDWQAAVEDYRNAVELSVKMSNYRGITDAGGLLAQAYEHRGELAAGLDAINTALAANKHISDELYLLPRNLGIKARITDELGNKQQAGELYKTSIALVNGMMQHASTINIERILLAEMSDVYSGYFSSLCTQQRYGDALATLEQVRGRVETQALQHHANQPVHAETAEEKELTRLNLSLIDTDDPATRNTISNAIYAAELKISPSRLARETITRPVRLTELQRSLSPTSLVIEYVLAEPSSYVLVVSHAGVTSYQLPSKSAIESDANAYRKVLHAKKEDTGLARQLFSELLGPIAQYGEKPDLVIIPDGALHLLPFSALADSTGYVIRSHTVDVAPSSTVFNILAKRVHTEDVPSMPYLGVAAWTQAPDTRNPVVRAISGPERSQFVALPASKEEVETIAQDLPRPNTILLGADATEARFKEVAVGSTDVVHLALHGLADLDYPDRSALIFAPDASGKEDGLLQLREIRDLHLQAKLVTLSACDTGVGPVGEAGVANLVNAFIEAGADSVVSTLWELEDHSTERLMTDFYSQLAAHKRKVDALRSAQLALLDQGLPPYFWASFQIVGDPNGTI